MGILQEPHIVSLAFIYLPVFLPLKPPLGLKKVLGSLTLGGYDQSRFKPNNFSFTFADQSARALIVGVQSIMAINTLQAVTSLTSTATSHFSYIDSTVSHLWLPRAVCDAFEQAFGLTYDSHTDLYLVNDTIHAQLQSLNPTITFKLGDTTAETGQNIDITLPYAAFDLQASKPYYQNATNYFPIRRGANDTQYVLGRTFLQEAYLIVDYERSNFTVAQTVFPDPMPSPKLG